MPIRSFRTEEGVTWQVWNVMPGLHDTHETRIGYDRRSPEPVIRYTGPERRSSEDRRKPSLFLSPQLATGWLTFECPTEKRRLTPIPQHWEDFPRPSWSACAARPARCARVPPPARPPSS